MERKNYGPCHYCNKDILEPEETARTRIGGTGYALTTKDEKVCYACCEKLELLEAETTGKWVGYLTREPTGEKLESELAIVKAQFRPFRYFASNWPGTLKIPVYHVKESRHNIGRTRTDVWFRLPGDAFVWHGVQIGDNNQILRAKRTKQKEF